MHDEREAQGSLFGHGADRRPEHQGGGDRPGDRKRRPREKKPWALPIPLGQVNPPQFPVHALPKDMGAWVAAIGTATQTPPDLGAFMALAATSTAIAKKIRVRVRGQWEEPTNLCLVAALAPGTRKTAVVEAAVAPLNDWVAAVRAAIHSDAKSARRRKDIADATYRQAYSRAVRATEPENAALIDEAMRLANEADNVRIPVVPCLLADDATPAALIDLMAEQGGRIAYLSDEGGVLDAIGRARMASGVPSLDLYLKAHSGSAFSNRRKGRPPISFAKPSIVFGLCVQHEILRGLGQRRHLRGVGLLARFCYAVPKCTVGTRDTVPPPMPPEVSAEYAAALQALLELPDERDDQSETTARVLDVSPEALDLLDELAAELEPRLGPDGDLAPIADWVLKLAGTTARIAGSLHMFNRARRWKEGVPPIPADTMAAAIEIGRYLLEHAMAAFDLLGADPVQDDAEHVLRWLQKERPETFSARDAFERVKGRLHTMRRLNPALDLLEGHFFIRALAPAPRRGPGRSASDRYVTNPQFLGAE